MVKIRVLCLIETENVEKIEIDVEEYVWKVKTQCINCKQKSPKHLYVDPSKQMKISGSRGSANCLFKCKSCKRESCIDIEMSSYTPYKCKDEKEWISIIIFDCKNCEVVEWVPTDGFTAFSKSKEFKVELEEGEWADYDDEDDVSVGIYGFSTKLEVVKKSGKKDKKKKKYGKK